MKKSIICLGICLLTLSNVTIASAENLPVAKNQTFSAYETTTPLCVAISKRENELAKKLIEYGASFTEKSNGMTPLMVAARYNNTEMLRYLIEKGVRISERDEKGFTALKYAELSGAKDAIAILKG